MGQQLYTGFHAIEEKLKSLQKEHEGLAFIIHYSKQGPRVKKILSLAKSLNVTILQESDVALDTLATALPPQARDHRGIILEVQGDIKKTNNISLETWLLTCPPKATVLLLDSITDPHNVGAIIRSCDQFNVDLLIVPERNSPSSIQENDIIARSSSGASAWVNVSVVTNLVRATKMVKDAGFWIYGADAGGTSLVHTAFADKTCIIMGNEGSGISRLLSKDCDTIISIPANGKLDSLNVSVAAGILLYERKRQDL